MKGKPGPKNVEDKNAKKGQTHVKKITKGKKTRDTKKNEKIERKKGEAQNTKKKRKRSRRNEKVRLEKLQKVRQTNSENEVLLRKSGRKWSVRRGTQAAMSKKGNPRCKNNKKSVSTFSKLKQS